MSIIFQFTIQKKIVQHKNLIINTTTRKNEIHDRKKKSKYI